MIAGVGVDMVRIGRMEKSLGSEAFWQRVFGEEERAFLEKLAPARRAASAAANFAAKEAFLEGLRQRAGRLCAGGHPGAEGPRAARLITR